MKRKTRRARLFLHPSSPRLRPSVRALLATALAVSLLSHGCIERERGETFYGRVVVPAAQEFRWSDGGLPRVFDPAIAAAPPDTDAVRALFEGLTDYDPQTLAPIPAVAVSWEPGEGGRTWTFRLRGDARWSNGDPVTAHDFVRSWRRTLQLGERAPHSGLMRNIEGAPRLIRLRPEALEPGYFSVEEVEREGEAAEGDAASGAGPAAAAPVPVPKTFGARALDDHTLAVRLKRPDHNFPALVAHPVFRPVHELGAHADLSAPEAEGPGPEETLITNGAFRLTGRVGEGVVLERAATYWDAEKIALERVRFVETDGSEGALAAYRSGAVDAITNAAVEPLALKLLAPFRDFRRETFAALTYYQFNASRPHFADRRVRLAFAHALDLERLCSDVLGGAPVPAGKFMPAPGANGVREAGGASGESGADASGQQLGYDPARARALLAEAGYAGGAGFPAVSLLVNRNEQQRLLAEAVAGMWREVLGVETQIVVKGWGEYQAALRAGEFDVARRGLVMQTPDEETNLLAMFEVEGAAGAQQASPAGPAVGPAEAGAGLSAGGGAALTPVAAEALSTEAGALAELPAIPIYFASSFALVKPYVKGFETNLLDAPSLKRVRIETGWTDAGRRADGE